MTQYPNPNDLSLQTQSGDSTFENVYIFGKLKYSYDGDDITVRSINVREPSAFSKDVTFSGDIDVSGSANITGDFAVDELTARNANITGIVTTSGDFYALGRFRDENSNPGTSGQILASTGNGVDWIDANTTSVNNSINVGVNVNGDNANQFVSFFGANSGNQPNRVDNDFTYNPSTNTLTVGTISATTVVSTGSGAFVSGMIIAWSGSVANIPTGFVLCDGSNNTPDLRDRFIIGAGNNYAVDATGGSKDAVLVEHFHTTLNFVARSNYAEPRNFGVGTDGNCNSTGNTDTKGVSGTDKNLPPYHALCFIMKT
tara:strand:- start:57 stop:998 length:942 start_codon:yes stop_codon:yes gene_type:complete